MTADPPPPSATGSTPSQPPFDPNSPVRRIRFRPEGYEQLQWLLVLLGSALVFFGMLDLAFIVSAMRWGDPQWTILTVGRLVNNLWGPAIGLVLVLMPVGSSTQVTLLGYRRFCSHLALPLGLVFLLLVPVGLRTTIQIANWAERRQATVTAQQEQGLEQTLTTLESLQTPGQMAAFLDPVDLSPDLFRQEDDAEALRALLVTTLTSITERNQAGVREEAERYRSGILQDGIKWAILSLGGSLLYFGLWHFSREYRLMKRQLLPRH